MNRTPRRHIAVAAVVVLAGVAIPLAAADSGLPGPNSTASVDGKQSLGNSSATTESGSTATSTGRDTQGADSNGGTANANPYVYDSGQSPDIEIEGVLSVKRQLRESLSPVFEQLKP